MVLRRTGKIAGFADLRGTSARKHAIHQWLAKEFPRNSAGNFSPANRECFFENREIWLSQNEIEYKRSFDNEGP
jgi:hypothetical protein